jgi:hypothetical protein
MEVGAERLEHGAIDGLLVSPPPPPALRFRAAVGLARTMIG